MTLRDEVVALVSKNPGKNSRELTDLYGKLPLNRIQETLSRLCVKGRIKKMGSIPYTYVVKNEGEAPKRGAPKRDSKWAPVDKGVVEGFIKNNPQATYREFVEAKGKVCSDALYYMKRRKITGVVAPHRTSSSSDDGVQRRGAALYMAIWSYPSDKLDPKAIGAIKNLVDTLNKARRARWELVEMKDPAEIELRERTAR